MNPITGSPLLGGCTGARFLEFVRPTRHVWRGDILLVSWPGGTRCNTSSNSGCSIPSYLPHLVPGPKDSTPSHAFVPQIPQLGTIPRMEIQITPGRYSFNKKKADLMALELGDPRVITCLCCAAPVQSSNLKQSPSMIWSSWSWTVGLICERTYPRIQSTFVGWHW